MSAVEAVISGPRALPQVFGHYLLLKRLSRGGMGEIFLAKLGEIQGFEKLVIIKKILPNLVADEEFIKRFIDEAQVAIKLNHANIAPVFEVGKVDGEYFLAIEYVEGRDLRRLMARLREHKLRPAPELCLYIVRELASGLAYAHRRTDENGHSLSVVHCDISPPNVMASFEGEVKIIDFGIAKSVLRIAGSNPNVGFGKFGYMAPEQLIRGGVVDRRTDVYSSGVVLYELLTGERLFTFSDANDYQQIARAVTSGKFTAPSSRDPNLDPELDAIVMRALARRPEERYQTAEELRDAIQAKLSQLSPTISADVLAHFMRTVFKEEIGEEHQLVACLKAVDVAPFKDELTAADSTNTVTFARACMADELEALETPSSDSLQATKSDIPKRRVRRWPGYGKIAMLVGSGGALALMLVFVLARLTVQPAPVTAKLPLENLGPANGPPNMSLAPGRTLQPGRPLVTPLRPTSGAPEVGGTAEIQPPQGSREHERRHHPSAMAARAPLSDSTAHTPEEPAIAPQPTATPDAVQSKFHTVRQEYSSFKRQYGSVLEEKWNAIATEITFGKADKFEKVNAMLDSLRRDMVRVKEGG